MSLNEFELIATYFKREPKQPSVIKGIGDDCAIVSVDQDHSLVMSMDTLVAGRHFPKSASPKQIATRAFCTCLSDLAAMGAKPQWFTLALTLPDADPAWLNDFSQSLLSIADEFECDLIGGDTTQGQLTITIQVHGVVKHQQVLTRDAAKVGDLVFVSGPLGDGAAALNLLLNTKKFFDIEKQQKEYLVERFYRPEPQIKLGQYLTHCANAAIDISDGLLADLQHVANASHVDIDVDVDKILISDACRTVASNDLESLRYALSGGDDYQLAFTVSAEYSSALDDLIKQKSADVVKIGRVVDLSSGSPSVRCFEDGRLLSYDNQKGYQHFTS
ncbi:MAG: thiamine-monophosphate kinase [Cellvibrionaceae bacterium]|jgi:thiamine-monophosphate kinase